MSYNDNQTYYDILGLPKYGKNEYGESISLDIIKKAKDRLKFGDENFRAPFSMWDKIDEAYNILSNETKRQEYDKILNQNMIVIDEYSDNDSIQEEQNSNLRNFNSIQIRKQSILNKNRQEQSIVEFKTNESVLIEEYRKKLDERIDNLLKQSNFNSSLQIEKSKYKNYIEFLKKLIDLRQNTSIKKNKGLQTKFQIISLKRQLEQFESNLKEIDKKIMQFTKNKNGGVYGFR